MGVPRQERMGRGEKNIRRRLPGQALIREVEQVRVLSDGVAEDAVGGERLETASISLQRRNSMMRRWRSTGADCIQMSGNAGGLLVSSAHIR